MAFVANEVAHDSAFLKERLPHACFSLVSRGHVQSRLVEACCLCFAREICIGPVFKLRICEKRIETTENVQFESVTGGPVRAGFNLPSWPGMFPSVRHTQGSAAGVGGGGLSSACTTTRLSRYFAGAMNLSRIDLLPGIPFGLAGLWVYSCLSGRRS